MTDPLTAAAATTAVTAATAWLWTKFGDKIIDLAGSQTKAAWKHVNWKAASDRYRQRIIDLYGTTRLFGHHEPVALDDIYTDVWILDRPTALRRFDIRQLRQDPALLRDEERHHGSTLIRQPDARRLLILGKPGAGKTTFLRRLALEAARGQLDKVPIFVTLKEWGDAGGDLLPFLARQFDICGFPDAGPFIEHLLKHTDHALVLFDGLDEVPQEGDARSRVIAGIRDFAHQYPRAQCLVTCRTAATDYTFEQFTYVELADFTEKQMKSFVSKWYHETPETAKLFLDEIARSEHRGLRELARIPLLLGMLCLAFQANLRFPVRRVEIYADALDALLRKWDSSRNIRRDEIYRDLSPDRKHQLFARLAARSFEKGDYFLPRGDLEQQIAEYISGLPRADRDAEAEVDGAAILKAIEAQHGILVERAHRIYSFAHRSFHEYYAARYIVDNAARGTLQSLLTHCDDDRWREVILLTASLLDDADAFFLHFRRTLDAMVVGDEHLRAYLRWAAEKAASVRVPIRPPSLRAYYGYLTLKGLPANARVQSLTRDLSLDLSLDRAGVLSRNIARGLGLEAAVDRGSDFDRNTARDLALRAAVDQVSDRDLGLDSAGARVVGAADIVDRAIALDRDFGRVLARDLPQLFATVCELAERTEDGDLQHALDALTLPDLDSPAEEFAAFAESLRSIMIAHRNIGHDWASTAHEADALGRYFRATHLLVECLGVANVSNRQAIEDTLLLPPGEWSLDLPAEKE